MEFFFETLIKLHILLHAINANEFRLSHAIKVKINELIIGCDNSCHTEPKIKIHAQHVDLVQPVQHDQLVQPACSTCRT